jgi:hypothetical protein
VVVVVDAVVAAAPAAAAVGLHVVHVQGVQSQLWKGAQVDVRGILVQDVSVDSFRRSSSCNLNQALIVSTKDGVSIARK